MKGEYLLANLVDQQFLTLKNLSKIIGVGGRCMRKWINKGVIESRYLKTEKSPGKKGYKYLINPEGLPNPYRLQYFQHLTKNQIKENQKRKVLPVWAIEKARARLDIIYFLEQQLSKAKEEGQKITPIYKKTAELYNSGHVLKQTYKVLGKISGYTLQQRWWPAYKKARNQGDDIIMALAPKYNTKKGERKVPSWYQNQLKNVLLHPNKIKPTRAIKIVNARLRRLNKKAPCVSFPKS